MVQLVKFRLPLKLYCVPTSLGILLAKTDGQIHFWGEMNSSVPCALDRRKTHVPPPPFPPSERAEEERGRREDVTESSSHSV